LFAIGIGIVVALDASSREPVATLTVSVGLAGLVAAAVINRAGSPMWAGRIVILALLLCAVLRVVQARDGFRSHAMLMFPGVLLLSVMLLDRASYVTTAGIVLLTVAALGIAEKHGVFGAIPPVRTPTNYESIFVADLTLLVFSVVGTRIALDIQRNVFDLRAGIDQLTTANLSLQRAEEALRESEQQLASIYNTVRDVIFYLAVEPVGQFRFVSVNASFLRVTGLSRESVVGKTVNEVIPEPSLTMVLEKYRQAVEQEATVSWEEASDYPTGRLSGVVTVAPLLDNKGICTHLVGSVHDITERKHAEAALRQSEARWNVAIENLEAGVVIATDTDQVIYRNPAAQAMHGFRTDPGTGPLEKMARIFQLWTPDGRLLSLDEWPMRRIKRGETLNRLVLRLRRLDQGWEKIVSYSGSMVESAIGERLMFVSVQDLTDQRKAEQALRESEERLRLLGDNLPESAVYQYVHEPDGSGHFIYFSAGIERLCGITVTDVLRDRGALYGQVLPEYIDRLVAAELRSKRDLTDFDMELPLRHPDGEVRWMHLHSRPRRLPGERTVWDGVQTDVTARKQAEDARKKQAELLRHSNDAMIVWKLGGTIESWNLGAERLYGYSEAEAVGKLTHTLLTPRFPQPWNEVVAAMRIAGWWEGEVRQHTREGREVVVSTRIQLIHGSDGIDRVLEVNRDITEARRAQLEEFARQKLESLGTLASGIAHDFNNLLGAVLAQTELAMAELAAGSHPDEELKAVRDVAIRGSEIVRQLMIYAGKESDILELLDVSKVVQGMLSLLNVAVSRHAVLVTNLGEELPAVRARTAQLSQVVINLVVNASDALGGRDGVIRVATEHVAAGRAEANILSDTDCVQLEVSDTGCGMSPETQAKVFDPFFTTKFSGRGLGLAVVHGIVRSLHGAIQVASEAGKGTTFRVLLPCAESGTDSEDARVLPIEASAPQVRRATVLLVEDEEPLRLPVAKMLRKSGLQVFEAANGSSAIHLLRARGDEIDLMLLDLTIPGISSQEVLAEAAAQPTLKVILTSAYSEEVATPMMRAPLVRGFIRKPFNLEGLVQRLRAALSS
jgi:PAS domain S-box-containing protein